MANKTKEKAENTTSVGGIEIRNELYADFKAECNRRNMTREELIELIFEERYEDGDVKE